MSSYCRAWIEQTAAVWNMLFVMQRQKCRNLSITTQSNLKLLLKYVWLMSLRLMSIGQCKSCGCVYLQVGREVQSYCVPRRKRAKMLVDTLMSATELTIHSFHLCPLLTIPVMYIKAFRESYTCHHLESTPSLLPGPKYPF